LFAEDTTSILPYLATLLNLKVGGEYSERVKFLDAEALRRQVFLASRRFFGRLAQVEPLMLVFEDLHWMDDSSARLLEHLLPLVERVPILICGISRPDPEAPAARLRQIAAERYPNRYTEIPLNPLSRQESLHLVCNLLKTEIYSPELWELIVPKAEGNPFFLEEIIRSLID
jgi:predicted ATPase